MVKRMNRANPVVIILAVLALLLPACKTRKQVSVEPRAKVKVVETESANSKLLKAIANSENTFGYYQSRGSAKYQDPEQSYNLNLEIIMEHGRYVYINVTALLGISVARLWITADSVSILDILHKKHYVSGFESLARSTNVPLNLDMVQRIFSGNTLFVADEQNMTADTLLSYILINTFLPGNKVQTTYYRQSDLKVNRWSILEKSTGREMRTEFADWYQQGNNLFPKEMTINIKSEKNIACAIDLDYFAFDKKKETKFVVPKNFETIRR